MIRRTDHVDVGRKKIIIFLIIKVMIVKYSKERGLFHIRAKYQRITQVTQEQAGSSAARLLSNMTTD